jgi:hypothetical protein
LPTNEPPFGANDNRSRISFFDTTTSERFSCASRDPVAVPTAWEAKPMLRRKRRWLVSSIQIDLADAVVGTLSTSTHDTAANKAHLRTPNARTLPRYRRESVKQCVSARVTPANVNGWAASSPLALRVKLAAELHRVRFRLG